MAPFKGAVIILNFYNLNQVANPDNPDNIARRIVNNRRDHILRYVKVFLGS